MLDSADNHLRAGRHPEALQAYQEALQALSALPEHYAESGIVVGNPLFHLLAGLSSRLAQRRNEGGHDKQRAQAVLPETTTVSSQACV